MSKKQNRSTDCPCGSGLSPELCCGQYLAGELAPTAEALMRSRYTAYVLNDETYLRKSWHPDTRPAKLDLDDGGRWLGLKIKRTEAGGADDETGMVEFIARYKISGKGHRLHETSRFIRYEGRWVYLDGETGGNLIVE